MEKELQKLDAKMKTMTDTIVKLKEDKLRLAKELADLKKEQKKSSSTGRKTRVESAPATSPAVAQ
jgi:predicted  nucleic acid-binding Zn-ribbon protein